MLPARVAREPLLESGNHVISENVKQPWINGPRDDKEGLAVHGVYPVVSFSTLAQTLTGNVMAGERCFVSMIYPDMAVHIERPCTVRIGFHPFGA